MEQYNVTGMSCAACVARVEKAVSKVDGVSSCTVSLLTNSMSVEGSASSGDVISAVQNAGYEASLKHSRTNAGADSPKTGSADIYAEAEEALKDKETPKLRKRLLASIGFTVTWTFFTFTFSFFILPTIASYHIPDSTNCLKAG